MSGEFLRMIHVFLGRQIIWNSQPKGHLVSDLISIYNPHISSYRSPIAWCAESKTQMKSRTWVSFCWYAWVNRGHSCWSSWVYHIKCIPWEVQSMCLPSPADTEGEVFILSPCQSISLSAWFTLHRTRWWTKTGPLWLILPGHMSWACAWYLLLLELEPSIYYIFFWKELKVKFQDMYHSIFSSMKMLAWNSGHQMNRLPMMAYSSVNYFFCMRTG